MMFWKLKTVLDLCDMENSSKDTDAQLSKVEDDGEEIRNFDYEILTPGMRELRQGQWFRRGLSGIETGKGVNYQWKAKGQCSRGDQCSFQHDGYERAKPTPKKTLHLLNHQHQQVEVRGEEGASVEGVRLGSPTDSRATTSWKVLALNYFVNVDILLNVGFHKTESVCKTMQRVLVSALEGWGTAKIRSRRRCGDKMHRQFWKMYDSWVVYRRAAGIFSDFMERHPSLGTNSTSTIHKKCAASSKHARNKGPSLGKIQVKLPHQWSPYAFKFEDRSQEETGRYERCACGDAWKFAKNIYKLKEKDKATFFSPTDEWSLPVASTIKPEERVLWWTTEQACIWWAGGF